MQDSILDGNSVHPNTKQNASGSPSTWDNWKQFSYRMNTGQFQKEEKQSGGHSLEKPDVVRVPPKDGSIAQLYSGVYFPNQKSVCMT